MCHAGATFKKWKYDKGQRLGNRGKLITIACISRFIWTTPDLDLICWGDDRHSIKVATVTMHRPRLHHNSCLQGFIRMAEISDVTQGTALHAAFLYITAPGTSPAWRLHPLTHTQRECCSWRPAAQVAARTWAGCLACWMFGMLCDCIHMWRGRYGEGLAGGDQVCQGPHAG